MKKYGKIGFTLIELIAVLVIMAIIALIVTPLVMSIIRKARLASDKRSVDAYGRSIKLAITGYLLDTGKFPTEVSQLTIEYSGNKVVCSTTQINTDSSVYLAGCTVAGRSTGDYTYGKYEAPTYTAYEVGDTVTYNNVDYYVIKDSSATEDPVTLLKAGPLTTAEVNEYGGVGTANNHVNVYIYCENETLRGTALDYDGYGTMAYYTSETCGSVNNELLETGCKNDYASSDVKYVVDAWKKVQAPAATEARLVTEEDYEYLCYSEKFAQFYDAFALADYPYWTMVPVPENIKVFYINYYGFTFGELNLNTEVHNFYSNFVRPVIVLPKSAL